MKPFTLPLYSALKALYLETSANMDVNSTTPAFENAKELLEEFEMFFDDLERSARQERLSQAVATALTPNT